MSLSPKDEIVSVFLEKIIFKFSQCMITILLSYSLGEECGPSFEQIWIRISQGCFMPSLAEIGSVILEKIFKLYVLVFLLFRSYLTLEKGGALHLNKIWTLLHKDTLCQVQLKLAKWFWRRFFNFVNVLGKGRDNNLHKLESPSPNNAKFGWNWPIGSGQDFFHIVNVLLLFLNIIFPL